jgi:DNA-binding transcriptional ArsR family regulator
MKDFMAITKAMSDENRIRVLMFLRGGELCVCQIVEMLGLASSTVSKHLNILNNAGLVESRKNGRWIYYRLPQEPFRRVKETLDWLHTSLAKEPSILEDDKRLKAVRKMDKEELCCRHKQGARE